MRKVRLIINCPPGKTPKKIAEELGFELRDAKNEDCLRLFQNDKAVGVIKSSLGWGWKVFR